MAKSVRASVSKRNKAKLRATVFGPVVDERTARLSAKLQALASQPKPNIGEKRNSSAEATDMDTQDRNILSHEAETAEDMDIDKESLKKSSKSRSQRSGRIQKRPKKNSSSIVFRSHPSKSKNFSKRK